MNKKEVAEEIEHLKLDNITDLKERILTGDITIGELHGLKRTLNLSNTEACEVFDI